MSLRDLPKSLIDAVCEVVVDSTEHHKKLVAQLRSEGLRRFGVKRESQLTESDQKAFHAWVQIKLQESECGCEHDVAKEDHMPGDEALYNKNGEIKKQMDEDDTADKDYDGDGEVESSSDEYLGAKDKAIKAAMKNEEESDEISEGVAITSDELSTNGAVGVGNPALAQPKHADVIRDTDPYTNTTQYRLLLQYPTNEGTRIYPPISLPGARSVADLRTVVEGLPDFNEAVDAALVHAASTDINVVEESVLAEETTTDSNKVVSVIKSTLKVQKVEVDEYSSSGKPVVEYTTSFKTKDEYYDTLYVVCQEEPSKKSPGKVVWVVRRDDGDSPFDPIVSEPFSAGDAPKSLSNLKSALEKVKPTLASLK